MSRRIALHLSFTAVLACSLMLLTPPRELVALPGCADSESCKPGCPAFIYWGGQCCPLAYSNCYLNALGFCQLDCYYYSNGSGQCWNC